MKLYCFQIYLYEYNDDCETEPFPRQCLPYAVLKYEQSVGKTVKPQTHQYSIRPAERVPFSRQIDIKETSKTPISNESAKTDSKPAEVAEVDLCVPRLSMPDNKPLSSPALQDTVSTMSPNPQFVDSKDTGLCVPRLTSGLPVVKDPPPVSTTLPPSDPRSQLSFLQSQSSLYKPSFGPSDDEEEACMSPEVPEEENVLDLNALLQKPKMPSLPPINLPVITDSRQLNPMDTNEIKDPRLRRPAAGSVGLLPTPSVQDHPLPISGHGDPRLNRQRKDPRLQHRDPRQQQEYPRPSDQSRPHHGNERDNRHRHPHRSRHRQSSDKSSSESSSAVPRKKLSLNDYKKKNNLAIEPSEPPLPPVVQRQDSSDFDPQEPMEPLLASIIANPNIHTVKNPLSSSQEEAADNDKVELVEKQYDSARDPRIKKNDIQTECLKQDGEPILEMEIDPVRDKNEETSISDINDKPSEDVVYEPHDMAQTLNSLSDPDDEISQSPPRSISPEIDDPSLAGAMQKLVEHSSDVSLFTEALKSLQESASEYGDQLKDPEFLVKKIAEKIEQLTRERKVKELEEKVIKDSKEKEVVKPVALEEKENDVLFLEGFEDGEDIDLRPKVVGKVITEIQSPDQILSPEVSNDAPCVDKVKFIPLETDDESKKEQTESPLDQAMKKTLEELESVKSNLTDSKDVKTVRKSRFEPLSQEKETSVLNSEKSDNKEVSKLEPKKGSLGELVRNKIASQSNKPSETPMSDGRSRDREKSEDRVRHRERERSEETARYRELSEERRRVEDIDMRSKDNRGDYNRRNERFPRGGYRGRGGRFSSDNRGHHHRGGMYNQDRDHRTSPYNNNNQDRFQTRHERRSRFEGNDRKLSPSAQQRTSRSPEHNSKPIHVEIPMPTQAEAVKPVQTESIVTAAKTEPTRQIPSLLSLPISIMNPVVTTQIPPLMSMPASFAKSQPERKSEVQKSLQQESPSPIKIKPKGIKSRLISPIVIDDDDEEDIDFRSGFPSHPNVLEGIKGKPLKPQIKINLKCSAPNEQLEKSNQRDNNSNAESSNKNTKLPFSETTHQEKNRNYNGDELYDPFALDEDVDERVHTEAVAMDLDSDVEDTEIMTSQPVITSQPVGFGDVDLRTTDKSSDNSQQDSVLDYDLRKSHSRSGSPPVRNSSLERGKEPTKFVCPFGLDDSFQPAVTSFEGNSMKQQNNSRIDMMSISQDSNSSDGPGQLFDAYSLTREESRKAARNEFGDVDWRTVGNKTEKQLNEFNQNIKHMITPPTKVTATDQQRNASRSQDPDSGLRNVILGLDFSNLKNILATVQNPEDQRANAGPLHGQGKLA